MEQLGRIFNYFFHFCPWNSGWFMCFCSNRMEVVHTKIVFQLSDFAGPPSPVLYDQFLREKIVLLPSLDKRAWNRRFSVSTDCYSTINEILYVYNSSIYNYNFSIIFTQYYKWNSAFFSGGVSLVVFILGISRKIGKQNLKHCLFCMLSWKVANEKQ